MKSLGKILGLLLLGILLILAALGFALTHLFDPNDYKDEIQQLARDKANLELSIRGDIGWSLFPWLGLELTDATLASADTPDKRFKELAKAEQILLEEQGVTPLYHPVEAWMVKPSVKGVIYNGAGANYSFKYAYLK